MTTLFLRCQCIDAICSQHHKHGCLKHANVSIVLNRVKTTHNNPLHYCLECAQFAEQFCDAQPVNYQLQET